MGRVQKNPEEAEQFYKKFSDTLAKFKGVDVIVVGDFNAKFVKQNLLDRCIGSHSRGRRNDNGNSLHEFMPRHNLMARNEFFKHSACHITTFELEMKGRKIFNQIDYIIVRTTRKHSLINARSYINNQVNTDHRLINRQPNACES